MERIKQVNFQSDSNQKINIVYLVKIALLSAIAFVVFLIEFPLPYFPPFLEIDLSDVVAVIGGMILGPLAGVFIELIKNILRFLIFNAGTGGVGELANFVVGVAYVLPLSFLVKNKRNSMRIVIGMVISIISMVIIANVTNYFVLIPLYTGINTHVEKMGMILSIYVPFNLVKGVIVSLVSFVAIKAFRDLLTKKNV